MFWVIYFLAGLIVGSFLNVVIYRLKTAESFLTGYSKCPDCQKRINWFDLIPLVSFLILTGRCRNCRKKISWQYPLIEFLTGLLFVLTYYLFGFSFDSVLAAIVLLLMLVIVVFDIREMAVPESVAWVLLVISLIGKTALSYNNVANFILGGVIAGGVIALMVYGSKGKWMGDGDIKIAAAIGIFLGFPVAVFGIFAAFIIGAIYGSFLLAIRKKKGQDQLPFTPFLMSGFLLALFYGQQIIDWYLGKFILGG